MSAILGTKPYKCYFNQGSVPCNGPTSTVQGGITASMAGGSWVSALVSGYISDIMGRKKAIMVGAVVWYVFLQMLNWSPVLESIMNILG